MSEKTITTIIKEDGRMYVLASTHFVATDVSVTVKPITPSSEEVA